MCDWQGEEFFGEYVCIGASQKRSENWARRHTFLIPFNFHVGNCFIPPVLCWRTVVRFLRRRLNLQKSEALFSYINQSFCPNPDENIGNLYQNFSTESHLIVSYCTQSVWG
uniref:Ubiquitin-like protein ATG12 n=1 Tax=Percolomonas cosmopolitus TaxID=63605 RepID=A0A7S1KS02_9EUKA|mmetsp:Transcript_4658/g.17536  ORF Transcript_4658/g.17536 Transcript_4658/m.17536 type:complete len:111 (+) Transcript_4658:128-460(+)